jgi:tape measure domain-containing protein
MTPKPLTFFFKMVDRFSPTANKAINKLTRLQNLMTRLNQTSRSVGSRLGNFFQAANRSAQGFLGVLGRVRNAIFSVQGLLAGVAVGGLFGGVVKAATFSEDSLTAFELMLGNKVLAQQARDQAVSFAAKTPFETGTVIDAYQKLLAAQFTLAEVPIVLSGVGDLAAIKGFDPEVISRLIRSMGQIKAKGRLQGDELLELANVGLPTGKFYELLAGKLGTNVDGIRKLQEAGKLTSDMAIWGILETIRTTFSNGKLGNAMNEFADNLSGLWSTLRSRPLEMMLGFDQTTGYKQLKGFVGNLANFFDPNKGVGKLIARSSQALFSSIFTTLFGPLDEATRGSKFQRWGYKLVAGIQRVTKWFDKSRPSIQKWFSKFVEQGGKVVGWLRENWPAIQNLIEAFAEGFVQGLRDTYTFFKPVIDLFAKFTGPLDDSYEGVAKLVGRLLPLWLAFGFVASALAPILKLLGGFSGVGGLIGLLGKLPLPVLVVAGILIAAGAAAVWAYNRFDWFKTAVNDAYDSLKLFAKDPMGYLKDSVPMALGLTGTDMMPENYTGPYPKGVTYVPATVTAPEPNFGVNGHKYGGGWGAEPASTTKNTNIEIKLDGMTISSGAFAQEFMNLLERHGVTELGDTFSSDTSDRNR